MLWTILLVLVSFFAIIGLMEFLMCIMESVSMRGNDSLQDIRIEVDLAGHEPHVDFLLSSLTVMAQRISFKNLTTFVFIHDCGMDEDTYKKVRQYCSENSTVYLIENE